LGTNQIEAFIREFVKGEPQEPSDRLGRNANISLLAQHGKTYLPVGPHPVS
jgi:hypothetical protein